MSAMSLKEELADCTSKQRRFLLLRISGVDPEVARKLSDIRVGTTNTWLHQPPFIALHRRISEFAASSKEEAIKYLRRENQLAAVLLEERLIQKMKEEVESGDYNLLRTNLAREVYTKLISDLDAPPPNTAVTWEQRVQNLFMPANQSAIEGHVEVIDANSQTSGSQPIQLEKSSTESEGEQASD
jgi:hypothetical protein